MSTLDDWLARAAAELGLPGPGGAAGSGGLDQAMLLDLARDIAHGVARPAAPLSTYLLGVAVGLGADPGEAAERLTALAKQWPPSTG